MAQLITSKGTKVEIRYSDAPNFLMKLDFAHIIKFHNLTGNFVLVHFQAMPKGERRWGVFDGAIKQYYSVRDNEMETFGGVQTQYISMPEIGNIKPTALSLHRGAIVVELGKKIRIQPV